jgi:polar amino acid transport system substrate-binding protein
MRRLVVLLALLAALAAVAAGCGSDEGESQGTPAPPESTAASETGTAEKACAKENLQTKEPGTLTIGTDNPGFPPWFQDAEGAPWDPTTEPTKMGYEAAVAYAVAEELGFGDDEVTWTVVPFAQSFRPGPKDFDFDINQISYSDKRAEAVDFTSSYYDVNQAVVALKSSKIANATSIADLKDAKLGAPVGTTSYDYIVNNVQPNEQPGVYDTLNDAISALKAKQIDGIVVDYPGAFYMTAVQIPNSKIVGQFPTVGSQEYFGLVLEKSSPLTPCVDGAVETLRENGTLEQLQQEWLQGESSPPVLE